MKHWVRHHVLRRCTREAHDFHLWERDDRIERRAAALNARDEMIQKGYRVGATYWWINRRYF